MGGNVEHEEVGSSSGAGEDASVNIKTSSNIAVGAIEGEVFFATTIIGLASVGVEVDTQGLAGERLEVGVLLHHLGPQVADVVNPLLVLAISSGSQLSNGILSVSDLLVNSVTESLVLRVSGSSLSISSGVESSNVSLASIVLRLGKVLQVSNVSLASIILPLSEVLQIPDLLLPGVILRLGPAVQGLDLLLPGVVLSVQLAVQLGDVSNPGLVVLLVSLLQRLDLILSKNLS